ncbi:hypothetical protein [Sphingosinicella xenopeptidilytica]|uniref:AMP-dependent synthetase/ligase domain-containing protein n=1 Tax=Sphingosinicella xenopeptidilytica TaxID=364098 RepID=A0ABW3C073_SPHXN
MFHYPVEIGSRLEQIIAVYEKPALSLTQLLLETSRGGQDGVSLIGDNTTTLTYGQLLDRSGRFAAGLAERGIYYRSWCPIFTSM